MPAVGTVPDYAWNNLPFFCRQKDCNGVRRVQGQFNAHFSPCEGTSYIAVAGMILRMPALMQISRKYYELHNDIWVELGS